MYFVGVNAFFFSFLRVVLGSFRMISKLFQVVTIIQIVLDYFRVMRLYRSDFIYSYCYESVK